MKTIKLLSLTAVISLPFVLSGCESLFTDDGGVQRAHATETYYHYSSDDASGTSTSRSYGGGGASSSSSKPRSERPSTSSTADSIEGSAAVPVEPPSLD